MATKQNNETFLQPIFSTLGLIVSLLSAIAPIFAQGQLGAYFIVTSLSLPASIVSVLLGIILSWYLITLRAPLSISVGFSKDRGKGYKEVWKKIEGGGIIALVTILMIILFIAFFSLYLFKGYFYGVAQATVYILFFTFLIGTFSYLLGRSKFDFEYEQQRANVGRIVYETLERNGVVQSGIQIKHNSTASPEEARKVLGPNFYGLAQKLIVKTVKQEEELLVVYMSYDYQSLLTAQPAESKEHRQE